MCVDALGREIAKQDIVVMSGVGQELDFGVVDFTHDFTAYITPINCKVRYYGHRRCNGKDIVVVTDIPEALAYLL